MTLDLKLQEVKQKLGEQTEKLEQKVSDWWEDFSPNYTSLEPWKRGLILLGLTILLVLVIYCLTHESEDYENKKKLKAEQLQEEKIIKRMELLKRLRK